MPAAQQKPEDDLIIDIADSPAEPDKQPETVVETPAVETVTEAPVVQETPPEQPLPDEADEAELKSYSQRVQQRIQKMSAKTHAERRAKETYQTQLDQAVRIGRQVIDENNRLKGLLHQGENYWKDTNRGRLEAQIAEARNAYKLAYEAGDADGVSKAQERMSGLHAELSQSNAWQPQPIPPTTVPALEPMPQVDGKAQDWQSKNPWFGQDVRMTSLALGVHQDLVQNGIDPLSQDYYTRIDGEMRKHFPDKFQSSSKEVTVTQGANVVAPASRQISKTPRKVTLTASQVSLAKRLGITPQQMAEEVFKLDNKDG